MDSCQVVVSNSHTDNYFFDNENNGGEKELSIGAECTATTTTSPMRIEETEKHYDCSNKRFERNNIIQVSKAARSILKRKWLDDGCHDSIISLEDWTIEDETCDPELCNDIWIYLQETKRKRSSVNEKEGISSDKVRCALYW